MSADQIAGIVLCGGQSRRMGRDKADLMIDGESLLARTVKTVLAVADPVIVAAAPDQPLPSFPGTVRIVRDSQRHRGPLTAFTEALCQLPEDVEWAFLVGCDMPWLSSDYLRFLADKPRTADAIVPFVENRWHPLAGLYRTSMRPIVEQLMNERRHRMLDLLGVISVEPIHADELSKVDPGLHCLLNVNTPEEFAAALRPRQ